MLGVSAPFISDSHPWVFGSPPVFPAISIDLFPKAWSRGFGAIERDMSRFT